MRIASPKSSLAKTLLVLWAILCISVFIRYPGSVSVLHGSSLADWPHLLSNLGKFRLPTYLATFLWSFLGLVIFCGICIFVGAFLLPATEDGMKQNPDFALPGSFRWEQHC